MAARKADKVAVKANAESSFQSVSGEWLKHWKVDKSAQHVDATRDESKLIQKGDPPALPGWQ
jgi:hypothetical protein